MGTGGFEGHEGLNAHLCVEFDEDVPPVAVEGRDSHSQIRLLLLEMLPVGGCIHAGRDESWFRLTVYLWLSPI